MAYVDLNPIRANIVKMLGDFDYTSIQLRIRSGISCIDAPLVSMDFYFANSPLSHDLQMSYLGAICFWMYYLSYYLFFSSVGR
ncbi:hypothetical protein ACJJI4_03690 [Microbulbifer sp. TRSA002]|uniref:hypothetical protein n=1 Tax=Microbulbifer sp. TRSA002 TaxID=3243382 RepID=UPI00403A600B